MGRTVNAQLQTNRVKSLKGKLYEPRNPSEYTSLKHSPIKWYGKVTVSVLAILVPKQVTRVNYLRVLLTYKVYFLTETQLNSITKKIIYVNIERLNGA